MSARDKLTEHFNNISQAKITDAFKADPQRTENFTLQHEQLLVDLSRHRLNHETINLLVDWAKETDLRQQIRNLFSGEIINNTENRPALHTALRHSGPPEDMEDIWQQVDDELERMSDFVNRFHAGEIRGSNGKPVDTFVHIGIGGSDLGPRLGLSALCHEYTAGKPDTRFVANVDPQEIETVLKTANPDSTLFIICSKSFTTAETLANANRAQQWLQDNGIRDISAHFIAVTASKESAQQFGIATDRIFTIWDWVGGRYSIWSAIGLTIALNTGMDQFRAFLRGANSMDTHFYNESWNTNIPVMLGLIDCWYINYFKCQSMAIIPYDASLSLLPAYISQLVMESNGKSVDRLGNSITTETAPIIWGGTGTNAQHAFMQLLHQGTHMVPVEFLVPVNSRTANDTQHSELFANCLAQSETLMMGTADQELPAWQRLSGNQPSSVIVYDRLDPEVLGMLLAMYEHRTYVQSCMWEINPFDQWGVERGKEATGYILGRLEGRSAGGEIHPATEALITHFLNCKSKSRDT